MARVVRKRRPEDRPDADLLGGAPAGEQGPDYGDDRDHGLGQGRADRRQHAPDSPTAEPQPVAQHLHGVGEHDGRSQDRGEGEDQRRQRRNQALLLE